MVLQQPKPASESGRPAAERQFVDREETIALFQAALDAPQPSKPLVLVFHGGAGTGKSRLRRELVKLVDSRQQAVDREVITATLDFDVPVHRQPDAALFLLRSALRDPCQVRFPSFDLAYAAYWQKAHPEAPLGDDLKPLLEPGSLLSKLLDDSGKLPLIGLVPKMSSLMAPPLESLNPRPLDPSLRSWWERRGERELEDLPQMEPAAIVEQLPKLWASDLKEFIAHRSSLVASRKAVLFIDSYEKLWGTMDEGQRTKDEGQKTDAWVREMVKQLPEALWVISGRQRLRWEGVEKEWVDVLSQHELGALPEHSAREFLSSCGITDEPIQDAIAKGSQGVPHYLNLAVDTFQEIEQSGRRAGSVQSLFSGAESSDSPEQIFAQFIRHLDQPEIETLQVLSASRFWNYGLFEHLVTEYQTGYPLAAYDDLSRFSFVGEGAAPETRTMHDLMREALQEHQAPELRKRVHLFLHGYYAKQLEGLDVKNITDRHKAALTEAFYHGRQAKSAVEVWHWFRNAGAVFERAGLYRLTLPLFRGMVPALDSELGPSHPDTTTALWHLAETLTHLDENVEAETLERRVLATNERTLGPEHPLVGDNLHDLAATLCLQGRHAEAGPLLERALTIKEKTAGPMHPSTAKTLTNLAMISNIQARFAEAESLCRQALVIYDTLGPGDRLAARTLDTLALVLKSEGKYAEAEPIQRRALAAYEDALGPEHPETARVLYNLANLLHDLGRYTEAEPVARRSGAIYEKTMGPDHTGVAYAHRALSNVLARQGKLVYAEPLMRRALAIWEKRLGPEHEDVALGLSTLAIMLEEQHKSAEAEPLYRRELAIREKTQGPEHPWMAITLNNLAMALADQRKYEEAESAVRRAIAIWEKALGPKHPNLACGLESLGRVLREQRRFAEAEPLIRRALAIMEHALGLEHPAVSDYLDSLSKLLAEQGKHADAEPLARRALAIREAKLRPNHPAVAITLDILAKVCEQTGRAAEAQEFSARAKSIRAQTAQAQAPSPS